MHGKEAGGDERREELARWAWQVLAGQGLAQQLPQAAPVSEMLEPVSGDASFRRYFRLRLRSVQSAAGSRTDTRILVDAPPAHEDCRRFVWLAATMREAGIAVPRVYEADYSQGFMLIEDFGGRLLLPALLEHRDRPARIEALYAPALEALLKLQANCEPQGLEPYDRVMLRREMALFDEWFCGRYLGLELDDAERRLLEELYCLLEERALSQLQVCVHRDYHSRNLMLREGSEEPGVIDFQDAVWGPWTYDLVSLLRDCYIAWPAAQVHAWALAYAEKAASSGLVKGLDAPVDEAGFLRDFDLMGLQRHLKVLGIFSRLYLRDGKAGYLEDIPRVISYVLEAAGAHDDPGLAAFRAWFEQRVLPAFRSQARAVSGGG